MIDDEKVGDFSYHLTSVSIEEDGAGGQIQSSNWEGSSGPFGKVFGTLKLHMVAGDSAGRAEFATSTYLNDGALATASGTGTWSSEGIHQWRIRMINLLSDGNVFGGDGLVSLEQRTFEGSFFQWS